MTRDQTNLEKHVHTLNACNQRGGRMLSLVDLVDAGSADIHLAAYLAAMMRNGSSLLVGAKPGGAGKTAVMVALLNFLPDKTQIVVLDGESLPQKQESDADKLVCYLAHEIGAGYYYAYVWGQQAREFFSMTDMGYSIASNLHTDTLEQLYNQLCEKNNVPKTWVNNVTLKVFLRLRRMPDGRIHRWISHVYEYDGVQDNLVWTGNEHGLYSRLDDSRFVTRSVEKKYGDFLAVCRQRQIFTIKDVRQELISI